ncbi:MAG: hypothetical protein Q7Q73_08055 [Verrucomicrobiota bacterium JB024]|nr:hypothetical protein [Verrucomicrobiota bacterium JB024]
MKHLKTITLAAALGAVTIPPLLTLSGCDTLRSVWAQTPEPVKATAITLGKAAAKLALNIGFTAFLDGVNETDPYREQLLTLLGAVDDAFETGADASQAASAVAADIAGSDLPDATKSALIDELLAALAAQSEAETQTVAAGGDQQPNYGGALYEQLTLTQTCLDDQ